MASKTLTFDIIGRPQSGIKAIQSVGSAASRITKTFAVLGGVIAGAFAVRRIIDFSRSAVQEFAKAEEGQNRLTDAFARFPKVTDVNIQALRDLNTELQNKTRFDDDALAAAQGSLAQYSLTGKQIEKLTPLLADFAAKTGKDLPTAAGLLGKALLGQGRGLKAIGVNFKDAGSVTANYAQLIDILKGKVGGFAESEGKTFSGQLEILGNQFGELKEDVGSVFAPALGDLADLMAEKVLPRFDDFVKVVGPRVQEFLSGGARDIGKFIDALSGVGKGDFSGVKDFFAEAAKVSPAFAVLNTLAGVLGPIMPVLADGLLKIGSALTEEGVMDALTTFITDVLPPLVDLLVAVAPLIPPIADFLTGALVPALESVSSVLTGLNALFSGNIDTQRAWLKNMLGMAGPIGDLARTTFARVKGVFDAAAGIFNFFSDAVENLVNALSGLTGIKIKLPHIGFDAFGPTKKPAANTATVGGIPNVGGSNSATVGGIPMLAEGGVVRHRPGGMSAVLGEGSHDEAVVPLSGRVLSQLGGGGGDTFNITIPGGFVGDENRLAQALARAVRNAKSRGAISAGAFS